MARVDLNIPVRLTRDLPGLGLRSGAAGVVCSVWMSATAYEVEFEHSDLGGSTRVLLMEEHLDPVGAPGAPGRALQIGPVTAQGAGAIR